MSPPPIQDPSTERAASVVASGEVFTSARAEIRGTDERTLAEQIALTEIEAPPFGEAARGLLMAELMKRSGLVDIETDAVGNVCGWLAPPGRGDRPVIVSAHLDTVFPPGTDVRVTRDGDRLLGPGIGDDGRGLAVLLALARAMSYSGISWSRSLLFVATVGEEGVGNLRGVRHLFGDGGVGREAAGFVSLDGAGHQSIVNQAVGSRRYRVSATGPGGHSWADWGTANPLHALAGAVAHFGGIELDGDATITVGRMGGGTSINAIPEKAWLEMEVRSLSEERLESLDQTVREQLARAVEDENTKRLHGSAAMGLEIEDLGQRPGGTTSPDEALVRAAVAATSGLGYAPELVASSTYANVPMALGIPSITLGAGGVMGRMHTLDEWYENSQGVLGVERALLTLMLLDTLS